MLEGFTDVKLFLSFCSFKLTGVQTGMHASRQLKLLQCGNQVCALAHNYILKKHAYVRIYRSVHAYLCFGMPTESITYIVIWHAFAGTTLNYIWQQYFWPLGFRVPILLTR